MPNMASCRGDRVATQFVHPALGSAAQGLVLEMDGMCQRLRAIK